MKVISKSEIKHIGDEQDLFVDIIISEFNHVVKFDKYHENSTDKRKVVFYPAYGKECTKEAFEVAVSKIKEAGWNAEYKISTCAYGWFHSIIITN